MPGNHVCAKYVQTDLENLLKVSFAGISDAAAWTKSLSRKAETALPAAAISHSHLLVLSATTNHGEYYLVTK